MATTTNQFFWYELMTSDHEAAQKFYADVVGWKLTPFGADGHPYTVLEVAGGRGIGGIMPIPPEAATSGMKPHWVGYVHAENLDAAVKQVQAEGGALHHVLDPIPNVGRIAIVSDPQGTVFNLLQPDGDDAPPMPMGIVGGTDWHELHAKDWPVALAFYSKLFGWSGTGDMDMGPIGKYQFFAMEPAAEGAECGTTCGAMYNDAEAPRPYWLFYFHVDAIDAAIERVTSGGGKVTNGPMEVPGGLWIINAEDPQGAMFALVAPKR